MGQHRAAVCHRRTGSTAERGGTGQRRVTGVPSGVVTENTQLSPGDPAPDFTLPDADGKPFSLADFRGRSVVVYC